MSTNECEVKAVWSIKSQTILKLKPDEKIESKKFETTLPNIQFWFALRNYEDEIQIRFRCRDKTVPDDGKINDDDYVNLCTNVYVKHMNLRIASVNYKGDLSDPPHLWGNNGLVGGVLYPRNIDALSREEVLDPNEKYFVNGVLELEFEGRLTLKEDDKFDLGDFMYKQNDKDFKFLVGNETILGHKFILGKFSSVFAAAENEIIIENFDAYVVSSAVKLCYGQDLSFSSPNELFQLINFCNTYDMPLIKKKLEHQHRKLISDNTVCEIANNSFIYDAKILLAFCVNFLCECIKTGKPFNGTLKDLNPEIVAAVFHKSFCRTQIS